MLIINASSAKVGGAKYIVESFAANLTEKDVLLISPRSINVPLDSGIKRLNLSTSSLFTHFFTMFVLPFIKAALGARVISFTNTNCLFSDQNDFTYFHNMLILNSNRLFYKVYYFLFKFSSRKSTIIVQTESVKSALVKKKVDSDKILVRWPGVVLEAGVDGKKIYSDLVFNRFLTTSDVSILFSSGNIFDSNKNFCDFLSLSESRKFVCLLPSSDDFVDIYSLGCLERTDFLGALMGADYLFVSSGSESLCLPVFEASLLDTPVIIKKNDWSILLLREFPFLVTQLFYYDDVSEISSQELEMFLMSYSPLLESDKSRIRSSNWGL